MSEAHIHTLRVYYEDTDFSGIVYHASYLRFLERGRTEWLRALGLDQSSLHRQGIAFAVRRMNIDFLKPARMDDELSVVTHMQELRGASLILDQKIERGLDILVKANVQIACIKEGRATRLPEGLLLQK